MNYLLRLVKLQKACTELSEAILVEDKINLYYMTGLSLSTGTLLVHQRGAVLLVDNRYFELCKKNSPFPVILSDETPLPKLLSSQELDYIKTIAFDSENTSYKRVQELEK